jgi:CTP synthase
VLKLKSANSTEFDEKSLHPVINMMEEQKKIIDKGATMRLGSYECALTPGTHAHKAYGKPSVRERHRHRFEVNNAYVGQLQRAGLIGQRNQSAAQSRRNCRAREHPWFLGVQFHPEFQSKPSAGLIRCSPLSSARR